MPTDGLKSLPKCPSQPEPKAGLAPAAWPSVPGAHAARWLGLERGLSGHSAGLFSQQAAHFLWLRCGGDRVCLAGDNPPPRPLSTHQDILVWHRNAPCRGSALPQLHSRALAPQTRPKVPRQPNQQLPPNHRPVGLWQRGSSWAESAGKQLNFGEKKIPRFHGNRRRKVSGAAVGILPARRGSGTPSQPSPHSALGGRLVSSCQPHCLCPHRCPLR